MQVCPGCGAVASEYGCPNGCDDIEREKLIKQLFSVSMPLGIRLQVVRSLNPVQNTTVGSSEEYSGGCPKCKLTACMGRSCIWHPNHYVPTIAGENPCIGLSHVSSECLKKELKRRGE